MRMIRNLPKSGRGLHIAIRGRILHPQDGSEQTQGKRERSIGERVSLHPGLLSGLSPVFCRGTVVGDGDSRHLIMAWTLIPVYSMMDGFEGVPLGVPYTVNQVLINGGLAGGFFLAGFYHAQGILLQRFPWLGLPNRRGPGIR